MLYKLFRYVVSVILVISLLSCNENEDIFTRVIDGPEMNEKIEVVSEENINIEPIKIVITSEISNLRKDSCDDSESLREVNKGSVYTVLETYIDENTTSKYSTWYKVNVDSDIIGWISATSCSLTDLDVVDYQTELDSPEFLMGDVYIEGTKLYKDIIVSCDSEFKVFIDGKEVSEFKQLNVAKTYTVTAYSFDEFGRKSEEIITTFEIIKDYGWYQSVYNTTGISGKVMFALSKEELNQLQFKELIIIEDLKQTWYKINYKGIEGYLDGSLYHEAASSVVIELTMELRRF